MHLSNASFNNPYAPVSAPQRNDCIAARSGGDQSEKKEVNSRMVFRTKTKSRTETVAVRSGEMVSSAYSTLALGVMDRAAVARMLFALSHLKCERKAVRRSLHRMVRPHSWQTLTRLYQLLYACPKLRFGVTVSWQRVSDAAGIEAKGTVDNPRSFRLQRT